MKDPQKMSERELRSELRETRGLLAAAKCPNIDCIAGGLIGRLAENPSQCQWCAERSALIG